MTDEEMKETSKRLGIPTPREMFESGCFLGSIEYELIWITHDDFTEEEYKEQLKNDEPSGKTG